MIGALLYLRLTSLRNFVAYRIGRLRQPKYLIGTAAAVGYFYFVLLRRPGMPAGPAAAAAAPALAGAGMIGMAFLCVGLAVLALVRIAFAWIAPPDKPGLRFSEAEIAFLFPAPVTRKTLIHFRLLSAQLAILFTSVLMAFFFNRFGYFGGNRAMRAVGWWVVLSTFDLHLNGTNLTLSRLRERPGFLLWRAAVVGVIIAYAVAVIGAVSAFAKASPPEDFTDMRAINGIAPALLASQPLHWLILPFRIVFGPYFAVGMSEFALAMAPALALLALHYYWVSSTEAPFEEGSIALAEKRAAAKAAGLRGELPKLGSLKPKARSGPFPLSPRGLPEVAFLWKNLLSMRSSLVNRRTLLVTVWIVGCLSFALRPLLAVHSRSSGFDVFGPIIVVFCGMMAAYTLLLGPQIVRQDLRNDLPNADILKTYPLEGWRLALGELIAPTAVLTLSLWLAILVAALAIDSQGSIGWLTPGLRVTIALCMGSVAPVICFIQLLVPNSIMVLMPGWYQASRSRAGGIEVFGQRLIFGFAQLLMALLVAAPAACAAALIIFSFQRFSVGGSIAAAAATVLAILAGEAAVGLWWLGWRFDKFDLSAEIR